MVVHFPGAWFGVSGRDVRGSRAVTELASVDSEAGDGTVVVDAEPEGIPPGEAVCGWVAHIGSVLQTGGRGPTDGRVITPLLIW